jgi:UDP-N-acetylmuramyl-tripeptide synthetase
MKLARLIAAIDATGVNADGQLSSYDPEIKAINYRSDLICPGDVFFALPGQSRDGHDFVADAAARGAAAIVAQRKVKSCVPVYVVNDTRLALAQAASCFYGNPSERLVLVGITGTNGKTTTAALLEHILRRSGFSTGLMGTISCRYGNKILKSSLTTPESSDLQKILADMADSGVTHCIMEVSSHGIALKRIAGCSFSMGIFTNLSQDHLDFHKTMDDYWFAKKSFFTQYLKEPGSVSVVNTDDKKGRELCDILERKRCIRVGLGNGNMVYASRLAFDQEGIHGRLHLQSASFPFYSPMFGHFNLENILCAAAAAELMGVAPGAIGRGIETFKSVSGRLQQVPDSQGRYVFIDFSHTPDALKNVLLTLGEIIAGRLICVFGCGGDRDRGKRPLMGEIAANYADLVVVTSDNPRTEDPMGIINDILKGIKTQRIPPEGIDSDFKEKVFTVEPDRRKAIHLGIMAARPGDAVLIAGKGHETYQIIGHRTLAFDDYLEAGRVLAGEMENVSGCLDS